MIRPQDFQIQIMETTAGTRISVTHLPSGNHRSAVVDASSSVGRARDALLAELRGQLFEPSDIRVEIGHSSDGDFLRVRHLPSGIERRAMRSERTEFELLDEVLEELYGVS